MEISGRDCSVPSRPQASRKLASVTRKDSALKKWRCASSCTTTGAVISRGTAWYSTPLSRFALSRGGHQVLRPLCRGRYSTRLQEGSGPEREQIVLFCGYQIRAVDRKQRLAGANRLSNGVGKDILDVA